MSDRSAPWYVRLGRLLTWMGLVLWVGALLSFGFAVAPGVFDLLSEMDVQARMLDGEAGSYGPRTVAGYLAGAILHRIRGLELLGAVLLLAGTLLLWTRRRFRPRYLRLRTALAGLMIALLAVYGGWLAPQLEELRRQVKYFDLPLTEDPRPERARFERLHRWYSRLSGVTLLLGLALMGLSGWDTHAPSLHRGARRSGSSLGTAARTPGPSAG
jgi:hypothetical protein